MGSVATTVGTKIIDLFAEYIVPEIKESPWYAGLKGSVATTIDTKVQTYVTQANTLVKLTLILCMMVLKPSNRHDYKYLIEQGINLFSVQRPEQLLFKEFALAIE
jgi:hypothetical protein